MAKQSVELDAINITLHREDHLRLSGKRLEQSTFSSHLTIFNFIARLKRYGTFYARKLLPITDYRFDIH